MGKYNFDEEINRKGTNCLKYDFAVERGKPADILPLWVADMDFRTPKEITEAIIKVAEHGIFGYSEVKEDYFEAVEKWFKKMHGITLKKEWLVKTPGIVYAIAVAVNNFTKEGEGVLLCQPVYYPFMECIVDNNRKLVNSQLVYKDGKYSIDFEDFEKKIVDNNVKLFLLCSPHNPVGRVWTKEELLLMAQICKKHGVIVLADEIHCDFTYEGHRHVSFLSLGQEYEDMTIVCTAPSKTFNIAGLQVSNIFIPNEALRKTFLMGIEKSGYSQLNVMGLTACKAAYTYGEEWLLELKEYLAANKEYVKNFVAEKLPKVKFIEPEGTYLIWLDFGGMFEDAAALEDFIINKAGLWLDSGAIFGKETELFERINIACTRKTLTEAMNRIKAAADAAAL